MGHSPLLFWDLSLGEIDDLIEAYVKKEDRRRAEKKADLKDKVVIMFNQAQQIANFVGTFMDHNVQIKQLKDYYPDLFEALEEEETEEAAEERIQVELEVNKAHMEDYAFRFNLARKRGEGNGRNDT